MDNKDFVAHVEEDAAEALPALLIKVNTQDVDGFDSINQTGFHGHHSQLSRFHPSNVSPSPGTEIGLVPNVESPSVVCHHQRKQSLSMPASPTRLLDLEKDTVILFENGVPESLSNETSKAVKFISQPMPRGPLYLDTSAFREHPKNDPGITRLKENRYNSFKTWSGKLERQITNLRGKTYPSHEPEDDSVQNRQTNEALPVDRYFDALEGPELETLRPSEEIVLPDDTTWPFLLRYPISSFGMCLGVSSQAIMWKTLATTNSTKFLHISTSINMILWCISVALVVIVGSIYLVKMLLYFEAVRREYYHPIRVNFFFAPWISLLFLALGVPPSVTTQLPHWLWYVLMFPFLCLELKIYGQWMSGGQRRLSKVANPVNHLSIVGNFVGALLGASMGLEEGPIFFFAVGMAHYLVLFVTLYQRLPTNETLPKEYHPVFFLFVAAPSVASMAWAKINGSFDNASRITYFIAMFLYFSLAVRINFFRGFKFSLSWWAYTFPMTGAAIATIRYSSEVTTVVTQALSVILSAIATLTVTALLVTTIIHAFVLRDLFPNDISIAISERKPKQHRWFNHLRHASSENIEHYLKFAGSSDKDDIEASVMQPCSETSKT